VLTRSARATCLASASWAGLLPHLLAAGPALHGQPTAIRMPHGTGLNPARPPVTQARRA
jgi:hypothetical protein